ncbi:MAG: hypothetical protein K6G26_07815 [Lachnospiraceae bacterium]|nr:hypothetical protein [Lachnospiraceae bacterium]
MSKNICYLFYGGNIDTNWIDWYMYVKQLFNSLKLNVSHLGVISESFKSGKIVTTKRKEKTLISKMNEGEIPESVECYSLSDDFRIAMFDYKLLCVRTEQYIALVFKDEYIGIIDEKNILKMKEYINFSDGVVFSTDIKEVPLLYADVKNANDLETYEFIKTIK